MTRFTLKPLHILNSSQNTVPLGRQILPKKVSHDQKQDQYADISTTHNVAAVL